MRLVNIEDTKVDLFGNLLGHIFAMPPNTLLHINM